MALQYLKNVVTLELDSDKCINCGRCREVCPHQVFDLDSTEVRIQNRDGCMECGACARNCPTGAVTVRAGVGCAYAIVLGKLRGTSPCCGESDDHESSCCE
jgi:NAD-dependent dihydropyrimidine dehydrogenase PreA subunit